MVSHHVGLFKWCHYVITYDVLIVPYRHTQKALPINNIELKFNNELITITDTKKRVAIVIINIIT